jgi:predicted permease
MTSTPRWRRYLRFWRPDIDGDIDDELRFHFESRAAELRARGISADEAERITSEEFGDEPATRARLHDIGERREARRERMAWWDAARSDLRYAFRALRRSPAFAAVAIATLALGIGANTAIFSVVNGVVLRPLPYPEPDRLVSIESVINGEYTAVSPRDFMDWRRGARSFSGLAASASSETVLTGSGNPVRLFQARVTANTLDVLAMRPVLGRGFASGEDAVSAPRVAMLSDGLWRRRFGADSAIVGRSLVFDGFATVIVGIAPAGMGWPDRVDVWMTTRFSDQDLSESARGRRSITVVGRLAPGASLETASAEMDGIARHLEQLDPVHNTAVGTHVTSLLTSIVGDVRTPLFVLLGAVGFVLLIACANVAALTLGRVAARDTELAVRTALGATRGRIARQVLTESLLVAMLGGSLGLLLAAVGMKGLVAIAPADIPRLNDIGLDPLVLSFTFGATLLTAALFGVAPALRGAAVDLQDRLRAASSGVRGQPTSAQSGRTLIVAEVALAMILLAGATLLLRSFAQLQAVDIGFNPDGVSTFSLGQLPRRYATKEQEIELTTRLLEGIRRIPGVTAADVSFGLPLSGDGARVTFTVKGDPAPDPRNEPRAQVRAAGEQYFAAMGIPLIRGRLFDASDRAGPGSAQVLVISAELARRYFPNVDPIGKYIETNWSGPGWPGAKFGGEIIGIVGDVRQHALDQDPTPHMYMSYRQWPINEYDVVVRSTTPSTTVLSAARAMLLQLDDEIPLNGARTLGRIVDASLGQRRFYLTLLAAFAIIAVTLAMVGIYGVVAYGVQQRRREIGIRLALGATRERVLTMVLSDGLRLVIIGIVLGLLGALALTRLLERLLFEVGPRDPVTFTIVPVVLMIAAALACLLPARKAAGLDPVETIRA